MVQDYLIYSTAWASFGLVHSLLAREKAKAVLKPAFGAFYRAAYNVLAGLHLVLVYIIGFMLFDGLVDFNRPEWLAVSQGLLYGLGWIVMLWALREYDLGKLAGIKQIREHFQGIMAHDEEPLHFNGFHRWMRHPLYTAGFMILWGRVSNDFDLMTAICGSLYLIIGSHFEERHLIRLYGDHYATYKSRVPAFIPWKGQVDLKEPKL
ncbi:methyltransferase [Terasakiella sp. SH-1]|uniref:methyltransferase family protein n=1 Tax=Terasakiella sp. SH-1 TaxID=2560057 RepID=UPI0010747F5A|nr:methyltransferase [Terasakiella sp. SH-1]